MNRYFLVAFLILSAGCANRGVALQESVENYIKAIRRADAEVAISYVHPDKRENFIQTLDRLDKDLLVSMVELKSVVPDDKLENAVVTLNLEYFDQSSSMVMMSRPRSLWKYDAKKKMWLLDSSTPFVVN